MCIFTHFAAGALAGGLTGNVYLGAAAGFASHAVLDVIPHYDHPDWRLELAGGVVGLILLLMMPFSSLPAVIGGIFGMVPDIENLLQKLGKMRRDQFIYPTHTGLLPHGRTLGPKSIVWQFAIFIGCYLALGLFNPGAAQAAAPFDGPEMAAPVIKVLASSSDRTVVRVDFPVITQPADWQDVNLANVIWALPHSIDQTGVLPNETLVPLPPRIMVNLAVPTRQQVSWRTYDVQWWKEPTTGRLQRDLVHFSAPVVSRSVPLTGTELALGAEGGVLRGVTIEVNHRATGEQREHLNLAAGSGSKSSFGSGFGTPQVSVPSSVINRDVFESLALGSRLSAEQSVARQVTKAGELDLFALTDHWVKLYITETGLYRLTGQDLSNYGVSTTSVDPAKLRLYRGGGLPLEYNPETPDADQLDRIGLNEVAIEVLDGGDGEWNLDDELRFYGVGTSAWLDRFDPAGERLEHYDHIFAAEAVYWLTWQDELSAVTLPGTAQRAQPVAATPTGGQVESTVRLRVHHEKQLFDSSGLVQDGWTWTRSISTHEPRIESFVLRTPVADSLARFQVEFRGVFTGGGTFVFEATANMNGDLVNEARTRFSSFAQYDSLRVRLVGETPEVLAGLNVLTLSNVSTGRSLRPLALDSFDILYWTALDLLPGLGQLPFVHWGDQVVVPGTDVDLVLSSRAGAPLLWDVSDPANVRILVGANSGDGTFTYGVTRGPDSDQHFVAALATDFLNVPRANRVIPVALRNGNTDLDYIVVHPEVFSAAAARLAGYHSEFLPGVVSPAASAVSVEAIYDNFSGGQKDPMAIRNYLKWMYEQSAHRFGYVCFLGNASRDFRNYGNRTPLVDLYDFVCTDVRTVFPRAPVELSLDMPYASDDGLVSFDTAPEGDLDFPDLASGRLPALTLAEADGMVERAINYSRDATPGLWRNRVLMTADDVIRPETDPDRHQLPRWTEDQHTAKAESISKDLLPLSIDNVKIYGVDYDFLPGAITKPAMRSDIRTQISRGTTIFYYVGHGAADNLADEQIFQSADIANLTNGMKRPVFIAFSCDVGVFDSPTHRSMAEQFLQYDTGGAIGSICASQVSYISYNNILADQFFADLYPERQINILRPLGEVLRLAKSAMVSDLWDGPRLRKNSQRYNLIGDPGMVLSQPESDLEFAASSLTTLQAGARQVAVLGGSSKALLGAGDFYELRVEESSWDRLYAYKSDFVTDENNNVSVVLYYKAFIKAGSSVFEGSGTMGTGDLRIPFKVPVQLRYGDSARVRLLLETPDGDHTATAVIPAVRSATGESSDLVGPAINLSLPQELGAVRPGTVITAALSDTSGIAILGTSPGNSLLLEFDDSGFMSDVTGAFVYDEDSYTTGRLDFAIPGDLETNVRHTVALHASDALGNVGSDTLSFSLAPAVGEVVAEIRSVTIFPNPTPDYCRLIVDMTVPMTVQWDIYSLAGNRLWSRQQDLTSGGDFMEWFGRDSQDDEIANGTYLYVVRGLAANGRDREIRKTGKLVIMR